MKVILYLFAFFAATFALSIEDDFTELVAGEDPIEGTIPTTTEEAVFTEGSQWYKLWVGDNVNHIAITVEADAECPTWTQITVRSDGVPCYKDWTSYNEICYTTAWNDGGNIASGSSRTYEWELDGFGDPKWQSGRYWFIQIGHYYASDFDAPCDFTIGAEVTTCEEGTPIGSSDGFDPACSPVTDLTASEDEAKRQEEWPINQEFTDVATEQHTLKFDVPAWVGRLHVVCNVSDNTIDLYGNSRAPATDDEYTCWDFGPSDIGGGIYQYDMECYLPKEGPFYLNFWNDNEVTWSGNCWIDAVVCPEGKGGYNCTDDAMTIDVDDVEALEGPFTVPSGVGTVQEPFYHFALPVDPEELGGFAFTVTATAGSGWVYLKYGGFAGDDSRYGYDESAYYQSFSDGSPASFNLTQFDFVYEDTLYIGVENSGEDELSFGITATVSEATGGDGGDGEDGEDEDGEDEDGEDAAFSLVPAVMLVASLVALL